MLKTGMAKTLIGATLAALSGIATDAAAQEYPNRPITLVVAYAAGGPVDTVARIFGARLSESWASKVIIENTGGAGGMTGAGRVAKATPDGYYMLFGGSSNLAQNQTLYRKPLYNSAADFEPRASHRFAARVDYAQGFSGSDPGGIRGLCQNEPR
jgi:tripartite-type tricarboxylate transporter receptor subunit TctC